jgi:integrase
MAGKRRRANGWEYVFKRSGLLEKPIYVTFTNEAEGDAFALRLDKLLDRGIVPTEYQRPGRMKSIIELVRAYEAEAHPSSKDVGQLGTIIGSRGSTPLVSINAAWVDDWVTELKRVENLAPATIRAKVGALGRCADWGIRKGFVLLPDHPFRTLPDGYAQYTKADVAITGSARTDVERDRRLEGGEGEQIMTVIAGGVLARTQRPLALMHTPALRLLLMLALESAMRLREMYTLTMDQVDIAKSTIFLDKTKNGDKRQVPLSSVAKIEIEIYFNVRDAQRCGNRVFPWWNGDASERALAKLSDYLSKLFKGIFEQAGATGLNFHDLRHEATSRLFERTALSETQIMKITGHRSHRMMMRYANLRGSDLASKLW